MNAMPNDTGQVIAVVEDDHLVAGTLLQILQEFGFKAVWCRTAAELGRLIRSRRPDLCIVDLGLPDSDGLDLVRQLQTDQRCGILILTGRGVVTDRVIGLELGADDYMVKPFEPRELIARVRSILRRSGRTANEAPSSRIACFAEWRFEPANLTLTDGKGHCEELSAAEGRVLTCFLECPNRILTREQLAGSRDLSAFDRSIDVRISRLRKRLRDDPNQPVLIKTVYGAGYLFTAAVRWEDE
jgi:DNA-binding response OmpR family regulator